MIKVNYINKIFGDFKVKELVKRRNYIAIYKAICIHCGYIKTSPIWTIKNACTCTKCKKAKNAEDKFNLVKNKIFRGYKVIKYQYKNEKLKYKVSCINCGSTKTISCTSLDTIPWCKCRHHANGKLIAKHDNEQIGDFILHDTGQNAYNSRNRLYKAICVKCGKVKKAMYSDIKAHDICTCNENWKC